MDRLDVITSLTELEGTCYIELLPGEYEHKCWNDGSVFLTEDAFCFFEKIIQSHEPSYDHYAFTAISREKWEKILPDVLAVAERLEYAPTASSAPLDQFCASVAAQLVENFESYRTSVVALLRCVANWVSAQLAHENQITVLGI
jgi:hypothetical protein